MAVLTLSAAQAKDYKYETVEGDAMQSRIYTLDNGLKVYLSVNKEKPRIQTYIAVNTGSRNDPAETTGLAHYLEHLMFKGTQQFGTSDYAKEKPYLDDIRNRYEHYRTLTDASVRKQAYHEIDSVSQLAAKYNIPNEYDKLMASIGAQGTNAYTSNDVTCYTEDIPSNEIDNWLKIQSDRFQNMVIRGFHTELEAVYEEKNISLAKDTWKMYDALNALLYPTHPYGTQTTLGTQEHLKNPSIVNIENYYHRYYVPNNIAICMAGDFDMDATIAAIDKYFGSWQKSETLSRPEFPALQPLTAISDTTIYGQEAPFLFLGWRFPNNDKLTADTLDVISNILSNGNAGLFDTDLVQPMKVLGVDADCDNMTDYTTLMLYGYPKEGQTLADVRDLLLGEMKKLATGDFDDDLLPSVVNNMKLAYYKSLLSNEDRADMFVQSYIAGRTWEQDVKKLDRIAAITKQQLADFAKHYLVDNYVALYKEVGEDSTIKKIDKPEITGIPANRELRSPFVDAISKSEVEPIQPQFVDFKKELTFTTTKKSKLPVIYKQNTSDQLFTLAFRYDYGTESVRGLDLMPQYLEYIGTDKKSATDIKKEFYKLACKYDISVSDEHLTIMLSGLNENMPQALALLEDFLANAKGDKDSYDQFVGLYLKARNDAKTNQASNFQALMEYGLYGKYNSWLNNFSNDELTNGNPEMLTDMLKPLKTTKHTVLYFGPYSEKELVALVDKQHKVGKSLAEPVEGKKYTMESTPQNEVYIAPYEAKNIYMRMFHNEDKQPYIEETPAIRLFNEYFGGSMNGIVFQELRESRGLAYNAYAAYATPRRNGDPEYFMNHIISQNDKMADCIKVFKAIEDSLPQSEASFEIAKQSLTKTLQSARTTRFGIISKYLSAKAKGFDFDINERIYNALPSLTLQDIVDFEQKNIAGKPLRYIILGDEKELDMETLEKIGPVKRLTTEEIFGF